MNKIPSILVDTGFEVNQSGTLTEINMPSVVTTLNAPRKVTFLGTALNYIPTTQAALQEFEAPNVTGTLTLDFYNYTALQKVKFDSITSINSNANYHRLFNGCTALLEVSMSKLATIYSTGSNVGVFRGCSSLTSISLPELLSIEENEGETFGGCSALSSVNLPKLTTIKSGGDWTANTFKNCTALTSINLPKINRISTNNSSGCFTSCTSLTNVTLGSSSNPVSVLGAYTFRNCTQSGLTITIYTNGGAALSGEPWGATNATIVYEEA